MGKKWRWEVWLGGKLVGSGKAKTPGKMMDQAGRIAAPLFLKNPTFGDVVIHYFDPDGNDFVPRSS